jgi:hypothetical protein
MKRFLIACSLALAVSAISGQKASAWTKWNFNIGLNISREAAENNFLWGFFRNGPHPYAQATGGYGGQGGQMYGQNDQQYFSPMPAPASAGTNPTLPAPVQSTPVQSLPYNNGQATPVMYSGTQQSNGTQQIGYYYNYTWPASNYYSPYYWYGN